MIKLGGTSHYTQYVNFVNMMRITPNREKQNIYNESM